jgi:hypothetical protein
MEENYKLLAAVLKKLHNAGRLVQLSHSSLVTQDSALFFD